MYFQNEQKKSNRAVIYCRVSSEEQVKGYSLTIQEQLCREFVSAHGFELAEIFIEKGESAKTLDRTELNNMWEFCKQKSNNIQYIVAYKVDRIARNRHDYRELDIKRVKYGLRFRYVSEQFDDSPAGRFMEDMFANMAHFDNDVRTERAMSGMREAMRQGRYVWHAPIGYINAKIDGKANIIQTDKAPLMAEVFREIETGLYATDEVRLRMAKKGLVTRKGAPVTKSQFYRLVRNKVYCGIIDKFGEQHKGSYTPIISEALFNVVQQRLSGRTIKMKVYSKEHQDFPLRRYIVNEEGLKLRGYWAQGRKKKYPYYGFELKNSTIRKEVLEQAFVTFLSAFEFDAKYLEVLKQNLTFHLKRKDKDDVQSKSAIDTKIKEVYDQMHHYSKNEFKGIINSDLLKIHMEDLTFQLRTLEKQKEGLGKQESFDIEELLSFAKEFLKNISTVWATRSFEIKTRFQWFVFPQGVILENKILRTMKVCKLFKLKDDIRKAISTNVHNSEINKNTVSRTKLPIMDEYLFETKEYWEEIAKEIIEAQDILADKTPKRRSCQNMSDFNTQLS
ncbi:recombinase family protein [Mucilaginibacter sp. HMF5004]|uniref:recombinase family protein n=1 Tax=Mucilaginibacter rivuli TaxID=2857527 RepID=UPI001C606C3D|nr:recombinase family protein [Mucilaginibacter rivuli]MBW4891129.1 recombinase family protein [Mucilaginibacter rivuli]